MSDKWTAVVLCTFIVCAFGAIVVGMLTGVLK